MKQYQDQLQQILDDGEIREDRTGTGTKSIFGMQARYNLRDGFPAVTTKKLAWRSVVSELLWFLEGSTDERRLCEILHGTRAPSKTTIWTANANAQGVALGHENNDNVKHLGPVYGNMWRQWPSYDNWKISTALVEQGKSTGANKPYDQYFAPVIADIDVEDDLVGKTFVNNDGLEFIVLSNVGTKNGNSQYMIQFTENIMAVVTCSRPNLKRGQVKNPYHMSVANKSGCIGEIDKSRRKEWYNSAYTLWRNMMIRCHGDDPMTAFFHGAKGIYVDQRWRCFVNFYYDIQSLPGFNLWKMNPSEYDLDKDYYGNDFYGKESCIFLPKIYNRCIITQSSNDGSLYVATNKETNEEFTFTSPKLFADYTNLDPNLINRALREQHGNSKYWSFEKRNPPKGYKWRQRFFVDQIEDLIYNLRHNPTSRRHILNAWNVGELSEMALPPCHLLVQFYVSQDNRLSCQLYQRSVDAPLGLPFNIASYALLTHMLAQICELEVGEFIHTSGDAHIYLNQIDGVKEQLSREPYPLPTLLMPKFTTLEELLMTSPEDYKLVNYKCHPTINFPFAV